MSVDQQDLSASVAAIQAGPPQNMWSFTIDPTKADLGQEYEFQGVPNCDHIWLPTLYDAIYGLNPIQTSGESQQCLCPGGGFATGTVQASLVGMNVFDAYNSLNGTAPQVIQTAAVMALRFNALSNPWTLWSVGSGLSIFVWDAADLVSYPGQASFMRSISTPIARLWWKLLIPAFDGAGNNSPGGTNGYSYSQLRFMASLGVNHTTVETANNTLYAASGGDAPVSLPDTSRSYGGGGYVTPQMNTAQRLAFAKGY